MQQFNMLAVVAIAAIIPLIMGMIWYSKALFGKAWMRTNNLREDEMKAGNMALTIFLAYILSFVLCFGLAPIVIHQFGAHSLVMKDTSQRTIAWLNEVKTTYSNNYRTFKHGALHGTLTAIFIGLPVIGTIALFERRSFKYVAIHVGYWMVAMALAGGFICQFAKIS